MKKFKEMRLSDINKPAEKFFESPQNTIRWLLNFSQLTLSELSEADGLNLRAEVYLFLGAIPEYSSISDRGGMWKRGKHIVCLPIEINSQRQIYWFQSEARACLEKVLAGEAITFTLSSLEISLDPVRDSSSKVYLKNTPWALSILGKRFRNAVKSSLLLHLKKYAHRIRRCPECKTLFLADRKKQSHCSPEHQDTAEPKE